MPITPVTDYSLSLSASLIADDMQKFIDDMGLRLELNDEGREVLNSLVAARIYFVSLSYAFSAAEDKSGDSSCL